MSESTNGETVTRLQRRLTVLEQNLEHDRALSVQREAEFENQLEYARQELDSLRGPSTPMTEPGADVSTPAVPEAQPLQQPSQQPSHHPPHREHRPAFSISLETLLQPRLLGGVGAITVFLGLAFLVAFQSGTWASPTVRVVLASTVCVLLGGVAVWLRERREVRTLATIMLAAAIAGAYATLTVAAAAYDLIPDSVGFAAAALVAGAAVGLARRYNEEGLAALAVTGALLSPLLVGLDDHAGAAIYLSLALIATLAVSQLNGWRWVGVISLLAIPQAIGIAPELSPRAGEALLALHWLAITGVATWRLAKPGVDLDVPALSMLALSSMVLAPAGWLIWHEDSHTLALAWIFGLGAASWLEGFLIWRNGGRREVAEAVGLLGSVAVISGLALALHGVALVAALAAKAALTAILLRRASLVARMAAWAALAVAVAHTLIYEAPANLALGNGIGADQIGDALLALGCVAAALVLLAITAADQRERWVAAAGLFGVVAYLLAATLSGEALVAALLALGLATLLLGRKLSLGPISEAGFWAAMGIATVHVGIYEAPPISLRDGLDSWSAAALSLAAIGGALIAYTGIGAFRAQAAHLAVLVFVYLGSVSIIDLFPATDDASLGGAKVQAGQMLLSGFWGVAGFAVLIFGLSRGRRDTSALGLGLFALALAKLVGFDLANLEPTFRGLSFLVVGLLLLAAAFLYQRMRRASLIGSIDESSNAQPNG